MPHFIVSRTKEVQELFLREAADASSAIDLVVQEGEAAEPDEVKVEPLGLDAVRRKAATSATT